MGFQRGQHWMPRVNQTSGVQTPHTYNLPLVSVAIFRVGPGLHLPISGILIRRTFRPGRARTFLLHTFCVTRAGALRRSQPMRPFVSSHLTEACTYCGKPFLEVC